MRISFEQRLDMIDAYYGAHGYIRMSEPIVGEESEYLAHLAAGQEKIENILRINAKRYGTRGTSKRALAYLHSDLPNPVWGVEVCNV